MFKSILTRISIAAALVCSSWFVAGTASAWCIFNCGPSEDEAKVALESYLRVNIPNAPFRITEFRKTNGETDPSGTRYLMRYHAVVEYPSGIQPGRRQKNVWEQLHDVGTSMGLQMALENAGCKIKEGNKLDERAVLECNSAVVFVKTEKGWQSRH